MVVKTNTYTVQYEVTTFYTPSFFFFFSEIYKTTCFQYIDCYIESCTRIRTTLIMAC